MPDPYTKGVLTVIAIALVTLCFQGGISASAQMGPGCGSTSRDACWVQNTPKIPIFVLSAN